MGKNFDEEMLAVPNTIKWASEFDISAWLPVISRSKGGSLVIVASGGSLSAAHLLAQLHMSQTSSVATVQTPLEFGTDEHPLDATVWFLSASGGNNDILQAWGAAERRGIRERVVLCGSQESKLVSLARNAGIRGVFAFDLPAGRDGFLATNSLIAFFCLILRLYGVSVPEQSEFSFEVDDGLLDREILVVLYGGWLKAVAIDIESRFSEAALGSVQIADFRNFAHGRHHWLAKRGPRTQVLALTSPRYASLARDTLSYLPQDVSVATWEARDDGPGQILPALVRSLALAGTAAKRLGYDAGRPGVPEFGHRIYDLKTQPDPLSGRSAATIAVTRKIRAGGTVDDCRRAELEAGYQEFAKRLTDATFAGVVLDYDGTIVTTAHRFLDITAPVSSAMNRLLAEGMQIGIATGRGKSVHPKLRKAIEEQHWSRCWIGYYNGAVIRPLTEDCDGLADGEAPVALRRAGQTLRAASRLRLAKIELRPMQITVEFPELSEVDLWMTVQEVLGLEQLALLKIVRSSHSVDVLPYSVSKAEVVFHVASLAKVGEEAILKIGDRGTWPGNDSELLAMSHGLSVDQVSAEGGSCWNWLTHELAGAAATQHHLENLRDFRYTFPT